MRAWSAQTDIFGGYFYGYSYASGQDRSSNWTAQNDIEFDVYFATDITNNKLYA